MRPRSTCYSGRLAAETKHRAYLLLAISTLIILGTSPVIWHHLPFSLPGFLVGTDHLGAICLTALHLLLAPVHEGFHLILIAGIGYAVLDRWRAWRRVRLALAPLDVVPATPNDTFWRAAKKAGLNPRRIQIVEGLPNPAFTAGFFFPQVYVAQRIEAAHMRSFVCDYRFQFFWRQKLLELIAALDTAVPRLHAFLDTCAQEARRRHV